MLREPSYENAYNLTESVIYLSYWKCKQFAFRISL